MDAPAELHRLPRLDPDDVKFVQIDGHGWTDCLLKALDLGPQSSYFR